MSRTGLDFGFWMVRCDHFSSRRRRIYASEFPLKLVPCRLTPKFNCERLYFHSRNLRPLTDRDSPLEQPTLREFGFWLRLAAKELLLRGRCRLDRLEIELSFAFDKEDTLRARITARRVAIVAARLQ